MGGRLRKLLPRFSLRTLVLFLLLATSATGLWWHWEPWTEAGSVRLNEDVVTVRPTADGRAVEVVYVTAVTTDEASYSAFGKATYDCATGKCLQSHRVGPIFRDDVKRMTFSERDMSRSPDGARILYQRVVGSANYVTIADAQRGSILSEVGPFPRGGYDLDLDAYGFSENGKHLAVLAGVPEASIRIYRRRRPEWWWGVFCLWEFWLTAAFAGVFAWSIIADRRRLREETS